MQDEKWGVFGQSQHILKHSLVLGCFLMPTSRSSLVKWRCCWSTETQDHSHRGNLAESFFDQAKPKGSDQVAISSLVKAKLRRLLWVWRSLFSNHRSDRRANLILPQFLVYYHDFRVCRIKTRRGNLIRIALRHIPHRSRCPGLHLGIRGRMRLPLRKNRTKWVLWLSWWMVSIVVRNDWWSISREIRVSDSHCVGGLSPFCLDFR